MVQISKVSGVFLAVFGLALVVLGVVSAIFHLPIEPKVAWAAFSLGVGAIVAATSFLYKADRFALAALALFLGGTSKLWLTQPLFFMGVTSKLTEGYNFLAVMGIGVQIVIVAALYVQMRAQILAFVDAAGPARIVLFIAVGAFASVTLMGYAPYGQYRSFVLQCMSSTVFVVLSALNLLVLALSQPPSFLMRKPPVALLAILAAGAAYLLAVLAVERIPHLEDEVAYLFQARTFLMGRLWADAPPLELQPWLSYYLLVVDGERWFSVSMPGWPLFLAVGVLLGDPWVLNPIMAAACVLLVYRVTRQITDADHARFAAIFAATSPWLLMASATLMPHTSAILVTLIAWTLLLGCAAEPKRAPAFVAGLALGLLFLNRQLEGVIVGLFTLVILLRWLRLKDGPSAVAAYCIGCVGTGIWFFVFNALLSGDPLVPPMVPYLETLWHEGANAFGFGPERGSGDDWERLDYAQGHTLGEGLVGLSQNIFALQADLFGWVVGSISLILVHLIWGRWTGWDRAAFILCLIIALVHVGYWFTGSFYIGPRYWFGLFAPVIFLSVRGVMTMQERSGMGLGQVVTVSCLFALLVYLPWRGTEKLKEFGGYRAEVAEAARDGVYGNDLVLFTGPGNPGPALFLNHPTLPEDQPLFLNATEMNPLQAPDLDGRATRIVGHDNAR